jgi:1-acyl-sn-glycerol-3-phosphate acyltransferase
MILLRSLLFALWFYVGTFLAVFLGFPVLRLGEDRVRRYARRWARWMLGGLRVLCGITWEITGTEHLPSEGPALIASMHQSAFETLIWSAVDARFAYVFKSELKAVPLFGRFLLASGMIPVDRGAGAAALRTLLRETDRAVARHRHIIIFPQGTRTMQSARAPLLPGVAAIAARSGLPVTPVLIDSGRLWGRSAFIKRPGVIHIRVLPPLPAGLPRSELLARLTALFENAPTDLSEGVDNSVSYVAACFAQRPS